MCINKETEEELVVEIAVAGNTSIKYEFCAVIGLPCERYYRVTHAQVFIKDKAAIIGNNDLRQDECRNFRDKTRNDYYNEMQT